MDTGDLPPSGPGADAATGYTVSGEETGRHGSDGLSVRVALFWVFADDTWKLQGIYGCPVGGFGGLCDIEETGADTE